MRRATEIIARATGQLSRRLGRGGGTTLPGVVLLKMRPNAVADLASDLTRGSATISATNGKTTTARLVRSAADSAGWNTVANTAGSNLLRGVAAALLDASEDADFGLFEVDEAALDTVVDQANPRVVVLMNLFRDQLDRYGELETLVRRWAAMVANLPEATTLVLNADDPAVAFLGHERTNVLYFGIDDLAHGRTELAHAADSTRCPRCDTTLTYSLITVGHVGHWRCEACGLERPTPAVSATKVSLRGAVGIDVEISTPAGLVKASIALPGLHNAANAAAAVAAAHALGISLTKIGDALADTSAAFGRGEQLAIGGRNLVLLLAKNPAGANENIRTALLEADASNFLISLNDRTADGQDVSWIWDVDYEPLFERASAITISGDRANDLALRFVYGGCDRDIITIEPDPNKAIDAALSTSRTNDTIYALPTYTAMLDLRSELVKRGVADEFWDDA